MPDMRLHRLTTGLCGAVLGALQFVLVAAAHAASAGTPGLDDELTKQEKIYQRRGTEVREGYVIGRSLAEYEDSLSPGLDRALEALGPDDRWLDIGAGQGQAILDYYAPEYDRQHPEGRERRGGRARAVAISIEDRRTDLWRRRAAGLPENQMQYLFGRRLSEYTAQELGQFRVITDLIGGFSYTANLSLYLEKVLGFLELYGTFFAVLQDVQSDAGTNRPYYDNAPFTTEIVRPDGSELTVCSWLKSIACVEVSCVPKKEWTPSIEVFHVSKVCNETEVPALAPVHFEAGTPPERRFELKN